VTRITIVGLNYIPEPTGIAPYTSGLASGLVSNGEEVQVITAYPHYPSWEIAKGYVGRQIRERLGNVEVLRLRPHITKNPSGVQRLLLEIHFGLRVAFSSWGQPEVVILVSPALFSTAIAQARARLMPRRPSVVVWVQDIYSLGVAETGAMGGGGASIMMRFESYVLRRAEKVVVIHERFKQVLARQLKVRTERIEVVRNWTHLTPTLVDRERYREKFGWGDEIIVLHAGNMGAKQALENVIDAARLADKEAANVRFVLLGDGNQRASLVTSARGVSRVTFMKSLSDEDFQGAMAAADILLVNEKPGVKEMAVPSKLTSYFSTGRPVIVATDAGSITAEEIATARAGVRIDAGDPAELLRIALDLGLDKRAADEFGRNGAEFQRKVLSADAAITQFSVIISRLAKGVAEAKLDRQSNDETRAD